MTFLTTAIVLPLRFYLPGCVTHFAMHQVKHAEQLSDNLELWVQITSFSVILSGLLGLVLTRLAIFSIELLLGYLVIYCADVLLNRSQMRSLKFKMAPYYPSICLLRDKLNFQNFGL